MLQWCLRTGSHGKLVILNGQTLARVCLFQLLRDRIVVPRGGHGVTHVQLDLMAIPDMEATIPHNAQVLFVGVDERLALAWSSNGVAAIEADGLTLLLAAQRVNTPSSTHIPQLTPVHDSLIPRHVFACE